MFVIESDIVGEHFRAYAEFFETVNGENRLNLLRNYMSIKDIFQFSQLLELPFIKEMQNSVNAQEVKAYFTLELFTYGTLSTYYASPERYWNLSPLLLKKLRHLTIISLAYKDPICTFESLMKSLHVDSHAVALTYLLEAISDLTVQATINDKTYTVKFHSAAARDSKDNIGQ